MKLAPLVAACAVALAACEDTGTNLPAGRDPIEVTVDQSSYMVLVGSTTTFVATVKNATNPAVTWRSASPGIALVSSSGGVTGVTPGVTTVSAISVQDTTKRAHIEITVTAPAGANLFHVTPPTADLVVGQRVSLQASLGDSDVPAKWRSSAPEVAMVSASGEVTAVANGEAAIIAMLLQDTTRRATAFVRVGSTAPVTMPVLGLGAVPERYTGEVAARGEWAYTSTWSNRGAPGNAVKVWNVSGPVPALVDSLIVQGANTTGDVQISDDGALLVVAIEHNPNGAIAIYSRTTPARPQLLARFQSEDTRQGVHTVKLGRVSGRLYAFLSVDPGTSYPAKLVIVDITSPAAPVQVWVGTMGKPYVHDVFVRDGILFTALWNDGLRIFDIGGAGKGGSPSNPVVVGQIPTVTGQIHNIWWFNDPTNGSKRYVFLGQEGPANILTSASGDLHVIDVTDMANPVQVAQYGVPGAGAHNFWMDEASGILYAAFYNGGVRALDVRGDLGTCTASYRNARGFCDLRQMGREKGVAIPPGAYIWGVVHQGTHVYATDMAKGLYKLDASALKR